MKKSLKVYIAAPWTHKALAAKTAARVEALGHTITKRWWDHWDVPIPSGYYDPEHREILRVQAEEDIEGVVNANVVILLNTEPSTGKAVETGVALMAGTSVILVGEPTSIFHLLSCVRIVATVEEALVLLNDETLFGDVGFPCGLGDGPTAPASLEEVPLELGEHDDRFASGSGVAVTSVVEDRADEVTTPQS